MSVRDVLKPCRKIEAAGLLSVEARPLEGRQASRGKVTMSYRFEPVAVFLIAVTALALAGASASAAVVDVRTVLLSSSSPTDTTNGLPTSLTTVQPGRSVVLEVWAQNAAPPLTGLACVFVDVEFDASVFQVVVAPTVGSPFGLLVQSGIVNNSLGRIGAVGGCIQLGDSAVGVAPGWVLVARSPMVVRNEATGIGGIGVGPTGLDALGVSLVGGGSVPNSAIDFGGVSVVVGLDGAPVVLSRTPAPDSVVNRTVGVTEIVIRFDRPTTIDSVTIVGVNSGLGPRGSLRGNGTETITVVVGGSLPDRDRYTVTVQGPGLFSQWEFVTLIGDCDGSRTVDIFDLSRLRAALRSASFDPACDIAEDGIINIFDLFPLQKALKNAASVP